MWIGCGCIVLLLIVATILIQLRDARREQSAFQESRERLLRIAKTHNQEVIESARKTTRDLEAAVLAESPLSVESVQLPDGFTKPTIVMSGSACYDPNKDPLVGLRLIYRISFIPPVLQARRKNEANFNSRGSTEIVNCVRLKVIDEPQMRHLWGVCCVMGEMATSMINNNRMALMSTRNEWKAAVYCDDQVCYISLSHDEDGFMQDKPYHIELPGGSFVWCDEGDRDGFPEPRRKAIYRFLGGRAYKKKHGLGDQGTNEKARRSWIVTPSLCSALPVLLATTYLPFHCVRR